MGIAEKKAIRASNEVLASAAEKLTAKGIGATVRLQSEAAEAYDFESMNKKPADVLGVLGKVPASIVDAMATIAEDADYQEAFAELSEIVFVPDADADGSDFDYESSATLDGGTLSVRYAPLAYMHGGYERAIKGAF